MRVGLDTEGRACVTVHGASWMERSERCVVRGDSEMNGESWVMGFGEAVWFGYEHTFWGRGEYPED
jgi:hypothetical protein